MHKIVMVLRTIKVEYFLLALLAYILVIIIDSIRWRLLLNAKGYSLELSKVVELYFIGVFFNMFLPTNVGGDVIRAYKVEEIIGKNIDGYSSVFVERFAGITALIILAIIGIGMYNKHIPSEITYKLYLVFVLLLITALFFWNTRLIGFAKKIYFGILGKFNPLSIQNKILMFYNSVATYKHQWKSVLFAICISIISKIVLVLVNYILSLSLELNVDLRYFLFFIPLTSVLLFLPISIRGLGVREVLYVYFLNQVGVDPAKAITLSFLMQIVLLLTSLIGGLVYLYSIFKSE